MNREPVFASLGNPTDNIEVRLSYRIVELFSEGLYASPNKAVEELVANSFDAGAQTVHVMLSPNLHAQDATIAVIDDGEGMDQEGLKRHWLIGISHKRRLSALPRNRKQIGKFGIGKLATYVLANRLTHISKSGGRYYSTSMDYRLIEKRVHQAVEPRAPITLALHELTEEQAQTAIKPWTHSADFRRSGIVLFGNDSSVAWTVSIMSSLKSKVHEIKPGVLRWVLRTALPLRPDFGIWLNGEKLTPSKTDRDLLERWILGKDLVKLPRPQPKGVTESEDTNAPPFDEHRFGLNVPGLGRITGYAEAYKDLLTGGKSEDLGRSHGFFVYVYGRLLNVADGHFGISPNELRHGTFGRFRLVVHMDGLDEGLRSNREAIGEGPLLETARDMLRAVFNAVRPTIDRHDREEEPAAKLARMLAASPASLSRTPIVELARAVSEGRAEARHLFVPAHTSHDERERVLGNLEERARSAEDFVTDVSIDMHGSPRDGFVRLDVETGHLRLNGWHPFVAAFHDEFTHRRVGQPLELLAMAEVIAEARLHTIGVRATTIMEYLSARDQLLRYLADRSGRQSALAVANALSEARNNASRLEDCVCNAFRSLGLDVTPLGKRGKPDGVAVAHLAGDGGGNPRRYKVSLEAKSKKRGDTTVSAKDVGIATVIRHRDNFACDHAIVVGPGFPTTQGARSALGESIEDDRLKSKAQGPGRTITLMNIDDLAELVRLRPTKQVGLLKLRELFTECRLPEDCAIWVRTISDLSVETPPYDRIVQAVEELQRKFRKASVSYAALRVQLSHLSPPIEYQTDDDLGELCKGMAQMAPHAIFADSERVELDQSAANVIAHIEAALQHHPPDQ